MFLWALHESSNFIKGRYFQNNTGTEDFNIFINPGVDAISPEEKPENGGF
jgi:hypothetical protein